MDEEIVIGDKGPFISGKKSMLYTHKAEGND
jgi:hypothetical protein